MRREMASLGVEADVVDGMVWSGGDSSAQRAGSGGQGGRVGRNCAG